jgi:hypothetical protein
MYIFRLSETYLLRAEAYLEKNNSGATAADINVVRARAQAPLAAASQVDIDYLPDERLRELMYEELRMCTLCRMGRLKFYHKDTKCFAKNVKKTLSLRYDEYAVVRARHYVFQMPISRSGPTSPVLFSQSVGSRPTLSVQSSENVLETNPLRGFYSRRYSLVTRDCGKENLTARKRS